MSGWYKANWDRKDATGASEGWVNLAGALAVERRSRDRVTDFGMIVVEPAAVVTLASGVCVTVSGHEACRLFRHLDAEAMLAGRLTPPEGEDAGDNGYRASRWDGLDRAG